MAPTISFPARELPVSGTYDVAVAGGGPSGIAAAVSAKRHGLNVVLIEGQSQLGGMGTSGMVSHWLGGRTSNCSHWVAGGIFRELSERAVARGIALLPKPVADAGYSPHGWNSPSGGQLTAGVPFDPYEMAALFDEVIEEEKIDLYYTTQVIDTVAADGKITHLVIQNKSGLQAIAAKRFVDATGDADLAFRSGCNTILGREEDRLMTPVTLQVHMDGIDRDALAAYINDHDSPRFLPEVEELRAKGVWNFTYDRFISVQLTRPDTFMINTPRITGIDGTDGASVTRGIVQGRKEIYELRDIMRKHIPGCENARVISIAPALGVRETRRISGAYRLTVEDLIHGQEFPDTIGFTAYGWDLPDPLKPSFNPSAGDTKRPVTPIPYRVMVPEPVGNLICPGRAVSVERAVLGPMRVQAPCMAMGEAAGVASAMTLHEGCNYDSIDVGVLRRDLAESGAIVDYDTAWD